MDNKSYNNENLSKIKKLFQNKSMSRFLLIVRLELCTNCIVYG